MAVIDGTLTTYDVTNIREDFVGGIARSASPVGGGQGPPRLVLGPPGSPLYFYARALGSDPSVQTIRITNGGSGNIAATGVTVDTITYGSTGSGWASATVEKETENSYLATVTVNSTDPALYPDFYAATIPFTSTNAGTVELDLELVVLANFILLSAEAGTFGLSGVAAAMRETVLMSASVGSFTLTGNDAALVASNLFSLTAGTGDFALTGQATTLTATGLVQLAADARAFTLTGKVALLKRSRTFAVGAGSFTESGQEVSLKQGYKMAAAVGAFVETGSDATLNLQSAPPAIVMFANPGTFT